MSMCGVALARRGGLLGRGRTRCGGPRRRRLAADPAALARRGVTGLTGWPRPEPLFLPPPVSLLTVAQARRSASFSETPRDSYPSAMWSAIRPCLSVYFDLSPRGMMFLAVVTKRKRQTTALGRG